ncbi:LPS translocon maturation chaperone LptM [[Erwinia] mediterraneensis]|uniref:LPS translocon maturation chaperone LptM n=1 Tax=[Erwinia] mediterraneensis TaxID=2161819 RepID=UPI001030A747|nr:lipoprotein [[Erwinia] mediterraneensis]
MKRVICQLSLVLVLASLAGCGLKGPLYFPPQDQPQQKNNQTAAESPDATAPASDNHTSDTATSSEADVDKLIQTEPTRQAN